MINIRGQIIVGNAPVALRSLPDEYYHTVVTSPPYFNLRDYGVADQIGIEKTVEEYIERLVLVFREVKRVLRKDGTLWLNLGDSYNGSGKAGANPEYQARHTEFGRPSKNPERFGMPTHVKGLKPKDLIGIPWLVAFALQKDGWYLRSDMIWAKPNPMPESVTDRPTRSHEYIFLFSKSAQYFFDQEAVREPLAVQSIERNKYAWNSKQRTHDPREKRGIDNREVGEMLNEAGRNIRSVWTIVTKPFPEAHFAVMPEALAEPCVKAGTSEKGCCSQCGAPWVRILKRRPNPEGILGYKGIPNAQTKGGGFDVFNVHTENGKRLKKGHNPTQYSKTEMMGWEPSCTCSKPMRKGEWEDEAAAKGQVGVRGRRRVGLDRKTAGEKNPGYDTLGWEATCECNSEPIPCRVLDPFGGAGTTGLVAQRLGREFTLIELNPEYADMSTRRIEKMLEDEDEHYRNTILS